MGEKLIEDIVKIKADCGRPIQNLFPQMTFDVEEGLHLLMCPVVVILTCEEPKHVQAVQITYVCSPPFACSDPSICLDSVNGTEIVESHVFLSSDADISDVNMTLLFTITDAAGKIVVLSRRVPLPISLYCLPAEAASDNNVVFEIQTNKMCIDLQDIFSGALKFTLDFQNRTYLLLLIDFFLSDFTKDDLERKGSTRDIVSFIYRTNNKPATIRVNGEKYIIECMDLSQLIPILECVTYKLLEHFTRMEVKDFTINIKVEESFKTQLSHKFLKSIDAHAKDRIQIKKLEVK